MRIYFSKLYLTLCMALGICSITIAQIPSNLIGSNLLKTKWKSIDAEGAEVIYPEGLDTIGLRIAQLIESRLKEHRGDIGDRTNKVPLLLHNHNVRSNAFVTVGPFRSEFYGVAPQYKNMMNWIDELTIHEYRHVEQFANATQGITKVAKTLLGSWGWGGMMAMALPRWYYEGDAVIAETALSTTGRGRFPEFLQEYHAQLDDGTIYNYEKAAAGSMKDMVPSWYHLGYNMLSHAREKHGETIWADVRDDAVRYKGIIYPFGRSLKKHTGQSVKSLYTATMKELQQKWKEHDKYSNDQSTIISPTAKSTVINYSSPLPQPDGSIIAIKSGYNQLSTLIKINQDGSEHKLTSMGRLLDRSLTAISQYGDQIVWAEQGFHHRRRNVSYSDLYIYDIKTKQKKRLTHGHRYYSPSYSPTGQYIAVVSIDEELRQSIIVLNAHDASIHAAYRMSTFEELSYPAWIDQHTVAFVMTKDQKNQIKTLSLTDQYKSITQPSDAHISHLHVNGGRIYFAQSDGWVNNVFSVKTDGSDRQRHTQTKMGTYQPAVHDGQLYFSSFSKKGYDLHQEPIKTLKSTKSTKAPMYSTMLSQSTATDLPSQSMAHSHESKRYSKWKGLLNPHSLIPNWADPELSVSLLSDNVLGTLSADATATYNYNENTMSYSAGLTYAELYPEISLRYRNVDRTSAFFTFDTPTDTMLRQSIYVQRWDESQLSAGVSIPYTFSRGQMSNRVRLTGIYTHSKIKVSPTVANDIRTDTIRIRPEALPRLKPIIISPIANQSLNQIDLRAQLSMFRYRALQHINPRFGLYLEGRYRSALGDKTHEEANLLLRADVYLPGFSKNHSLSVNTMYQKENLLSNYRYSDLFIYPRGYSTSLRRDRFYKVAFNYGFPIAYPDLALGGLAFWKRLRGNFFYDIGRVDIDRFPFTPNKALFASTGIELGFDVRLLRLVEANFSLRYSYLLNKDFAPNGQQHQFDFFVLSLSAQ